MKRSAIPASGCGQRSGLAQVEGAHTQMAHPHGVDRRRGYLGATPAGIPLRFIPAYDGSLFENILLGLQEIYSKTLFNAVRVAGLNHSTELRSIKPLCSRVNHQMLEIQAHADVLAQGEMVMAG